MIESLVKSAEDAFDTVLAKYVAWLIVGLLIIVAAGFATAAATIKLVEAYGALDAYLIIASVLAIVAMCAGAYTHYRLNLTTRATEEVQETVAEVESSTEEVVAAAVNQLNPELVVAALTSLGPTALPLLLRTAVRNLPLLFALAAGAYIVSLFARGPVEASEPQMTAGMPGSEAA